MSTVKRVEGEDRAGEGGAGGGSYLYEFEDALDRLEALMFGVPEDGQVAALSPESEEGGEGEIAIHRYIKYY